MKLTKTEIGRIIAALCYARDYELDFIDAHRDQHEGLPGHGKWIDHNAVKRADNNIKRWKRIAAKLKIEYDAMGKK